jgi:hypothetical protein
MEIFAGRKDYQYRLYAKIQEMMDHGFMQHSVVTYKPAEEVEVSRDKKAVQNKMIKRGWHENSNNDAIFAEK